MLVSGSRRPVYAQLSLDLFEHPVIRRLRPIERDVYWRLLIATCAYQGRPVAISREQLAQSVNTGELDSDGFVKPAHPKTIQKALRELCAEPGCDNSRRGKAGEPPLIERLYKEGRSSSYQLLFPDGTWNHHVGLWESPDSPARPEGGEPHDSPPRSREAPPPEPTDTPLRRVQKGDNLSPPKPPYRGKSKGAPCELVQLTCKLVQGQLETNRIELEQVGVEAMPNLISRARNPDEQIIALLQKALPANGWCGSLRRRWVVDALEQAGVQASLSVALQV